MQNLAIFLLAVLLSFQLMGEESKLLDDFENNDDLKKWTFRESDKVSLIDKHATHGKKSLKIPADEQLVWKSEVAPMDWSGYDSIDLDVFLDGDAPVRVNILIRDKVAKSNYWDWHNNSKWLKPGRNTLSIPVEGLFRGEPGAGKSDLTTPINPKEIIWFVLSFVPQGKLDALYFDNLRLVKGSPPPKGVRAFDFGPPGQSIFPGFNAITWNTIYGETGQTAGLKQACGNSNRARNDMFPTRLYQEYVGFEPGNSFIADMPNGKCHVWLVFSDCGYWGGEHASHRRRSIIANGKECWVDDRGESGPSEYLFAFENIEPKPPDSIWDLYLAQIFRPARFEAEVADGKLVLQLQADSSFLSTRVAALVIYHDSVKVAGEKWIAEVEGLNRKEFESNAVFLGPHPAPLDVPESVKASGFWIGFPDLEANLTFFDSPGPLEESSRRYAVRGANAHFTFAVRPLIELTGEVNLECVSIIGPTGSIRKDVLDLRYVHHAAMRSNNEVAYRILPKNLRRIVGSKLKLEKGYTRQFVATLDVPADCAGGTYAMTLQLSSGDKKVSIPFRFEVVDVALDEPDFLCGFFGPGVPSALSEHRKAKGWTEVAKFMKRSGMNTIISGPSVVFHGFDQGGKPQLDFSACDAYFKEIQAAGFTKATYTYGNATIVGLHDSYGIGQVGRSWEQKTGKPFTEILKIVWGAYTEHAQKHNWPTLYQCMFDEPGTEEQARGTLELAKAYADAVPYIKFGGVYSVNWKREHELDKTIRDLFKTAVWSSLNAHTQTDFDKAKELGREIHIYNQGLSRYSFGAYQYAEMRKGAKGRAQWAALAIHGYQYFDLDGREPDVAVLNWGRDEIVPTLRSARSCEGMLDFRLAVTLLNRANKMKDLPDARLALTFLDQVERDIPAGHRTPPKNFIGNDTFRNKCIEHLKKLNEN
jgi:hypothetical protein